MQCNSEQQPKNNIQKPKNLIPCVVEKAQSVSDNRVKVPKSFG